MISGVCGSLAYLYAVMSKVPLKRSLNKMLPYSLTQVLKDAMLPAQGHWAASGFFVIEGSVHVHQSGDTLHSITSGTSGVTHFLAVLGGSEGWAALLCGAQGFSVSPHFSFSVR